MVYDVAVVGAGPAGATFARVLAMQAKNLRILLLDAQDETHKKPCGGLLAPDAQKALAHFDLVLPKSVLADPQIFAVETMDLATQTVRYYQRYYLNMDRYAFDRWLLSLVPQTVDLVSGRCLAVQRQAEGFSLTVRTGGEKREYTAKSIVGADGAKSLVRDTFFDRPLFRYVAIQQWFEATDKAFPFYSCIFDPVTSDSCSWLMHKDRFVIYGGCFAKEDCSEKFALQKKRLIDYLGHDFGPLVKQEACLAARPRHLRDFVTGADGVYLVGEAAGLISPSSFEGISSAIRSGSALAEAFSRGVSPRQVSACYRRKTRTLRWKLLVKTWKRWFMYTPWVRGLIMRSGLMSIRVRRTEEKE